MLRFKTEGQRIQRPPVLAWNQRRPPNIRKVLSDADKIFRLGREPELTEGTQRKSAIIKLQKGEDGDLKQDQKRINV